jgi:hypothetical protein
MMSSSMAAPRARPCHRLDHVIDAFVGDEPPEIDHTQRRGRIGELVLFATHALVVGNEVRRIIRVEEQPHVRRALAVILHLLRFLEQHEIEHAHVGALLQVAQRLMQQLTRPLRAT